MATTDHPFGHPTYSDGHCAEPACPDYQAKCLRHSAGGRDDQPCNLTGSTVEPETKSRPLATPDFPGTLIALERLMNSGFSVRFDPITDGTGKLTGEVAVDVTDQSGKPATWTSARNVRDALNEAWSKFREEAR